MRGKQDGLPQFVAGFLKQFRSRAMAGIRQNVTAKSRTQKTHYSS